MRIHENPDLYLEEMVVFLWDEFQVIVTTSSIKQALAAKACLERLSHARERKAYTRL
jgi:hypothetical protein